MITEVGGYTHGQNDYTSPIMQDKHLCLLTRPLGRIQVGHNFLVDIRRIRNVLTWPAGEMLRNDVFCFVTSLKFSV
jgi:hypothetical protein